MIFHRSIFDAYFCADGRILVNVTQNIDFISEICYNLFCIFICWYLKLQHNHNYVALKKGMRDK